MPPDELHFELEFYRDSNGEKPVAKWLRDITASNLGLANRCRAAIRKLEDSRWHKQNTKSIGDELFEVLRLGNDGARILFFFGGDRRIIIVHAFLKKTVKLPPKEKNLAIKRMQHWQQQQRIANTPRRS